MMRRQRRSLLELITCGLSLLAVAPACEPGVLAAANRLTREAGPALLPAADGGPPGTLDGASTSPAQDGGDRLEDTLPPSNISVKLTDASVVDRLPIAPDSGAAASPALAVPAWAQSPVKQVYVAAKDASPVFRAKAGFQCDGTRDEADIQRAVDSLGGAVGEVILSDGTFSIESNLYLRGHTILSGQGELLTVLHMELGGYGINTDADYALIRRLKITGGGSVFITRSHVAVWDVTSTIDHTKPGAFYVYAMTDLSDIEFVNCKAIDCGTFGFINHSPRAAPKFIRNLRYINCKAINCGLKSRFNQWVTGFCFAESNNLEHVLVESCHAEGNWESGFHQEDTPTIKDFVYRNCTATNNGRATGGVYQGKSYTGAFFGYGFIAQDETALESCASNGNYRGIWISEESHAHDTVNRQSVGWGFWCRGLNGNKLVNSYDVGSSPSYHGKCMLSGS